MNLEMWIVIAWTLFLLLVVLPWILGSDFH